MTRTGIVDYGVGNVGNVLRALKRLGREGILLNNPTEIPKDVDFLLLPGVGAFAPAMRNLVQTGWNHGVRAWSEKGRPLLGICLGMQLLCQSSLEMGENEGLGLLDGTVVPLEIRPLPHMGWNSLSKVRHEEDILSHFSGEYFYFVHSYGLMHSSDEASRTEAGGLSFVSAVRRKNVMGLQFHPERSGSSGLQLLDLALQELR